MYDVAYAMKRNGIDVFIAVNRSSVDIQNEFSKVATVVTFDSFGSIFGLKKFVEENKIDIINCHSSRAILLCLCVKLITNVKLVVVKHNAVQSKNDL